MAFFGAGTPNIAVVAPNIDRGFVDPDAPPGPPAAEWPPGPKDFPEEHDPPDWTGFEGQMQKMPDRYEMMTEKSAKRPTGEPLVMSDQPGPGQYKLRDHWETLAKRKYKLPPIRCVPGPGPLYAHDPPKFLVPASGELSGAVTEADSRNWVKHANGIKKGVLIYGPRKVESPKIRKVRSQPSFRTLAPPEQVPAWVQNAAAAGWHKMAPLPAPATMTVAAPEHFPEPAAASSAAAQEAEAAVPPEEPELQVDETLLQPEEAIPEAPDEPPEGPPADSAAPRPRSAVKIECTDLTEISLLKFYTNMPASHGARLIVPKFRPGYALKSWREAAASL
mmetsp:Transcript_113074/g.243591  ORF Transcript_113074/g.243591 Transcript_113074/m.243591 type:complete len:334 (-) Transcript_113074:33-1034(-)